MNKRNFYSVNENESLMVFLNDFSKIFLKTLEIIFNLVVIN